MNNDIQINEVWKPIKGFENYEISNLGRVKGMDGKFRRPQLNHHGYWKIYLNKKGKRKKCFAHRLVAQAFIPNPNNLPEVNHINGIKTDNVVTNLEWVTKEQNWAHAVENNLTNLQLTDEDILEIRRLRREGATHKELAEQFEVSPDTIRLYLIYLNPTPEQKEKMKTIKNLHQDGISNKKIARMLPMNIKRVNALVRICLAEDEAK